MQLHLLFIAPHSKQVYSAAINNKRCRKKRHLIVYHIHLRKEGDSNPRYPNRVRQFSKLVVSATHPSFQTLASALEWCKCRQKKQMCKISKHKFFSILPKFSKFPKFPTSAKLFPYRTPFARLSHSNRTIVLFVFFLYICRTII